MKQYIYNHTISHTLYTYILHTTTHTTTLSLYPIHIHYTLHIYNCTTTTHTYTYITCTHYIHTIHIYPQILPYSTLHYTTNIHTTNHIILLPPHTTLYLCIHYILYTTSTPIYIPPSALYIRMPKYIGIYM